MLQPVFHRSVIERFATLITDSANAMLGRWTDGSVVDIHVEMLDVTQRITARALFGDEPEAELDRFRAAVSIRRRYQEYLLGSVLPFADGVPSRLRRDYARARAEMDSIIHSAVARRRVAAAPSGDLMSLLGAGSHA